MFKKIKEFIKYIDKKIDLKKFFKFGITGVLNTAVDWLISSLLYYCFAVSSPVSKVAGQITAIINSYFVNKYWTFKNNNKHKKSEILKFLVVQGISLGIGYAGMRYFNQYLGFNFFLCQILIAGITIIMNYFGNKLFVFNDSKSKRTQNKIISLIGMTGVGKTTVGQVLAEKLNLKFFDLDLIITEKTGKTPAEIFSIYGEEFFRETETEELENILKTNGGGFILSCGGGIV